MLAQDYDYSYQIYIGEKKPVKEKMVSISNSTIKPHGGLWTSTFISDYSDWFSEWHELGSEMFSNVLTDPFWLLETKKNISVYVIDDLEDLIRFSKNYHYNNCWACKYHGLSHSFDFEKLFREYDGFRLTSSGQWATRMPNKTNLNLYGYDSESTIWGKWIFKKVTRINN